MRNRRDGEVFGAATTAKSFSSRVGRVRARYGIWFFTLMRRPPGALRLILFASLFYTDLHTRTEWGTPTALARVGERINALKPDVVLCGGGYGHRWISSASRGSGTRVGAAYMTLHRAIEAPVYAVPGKS